MLEHSCFEMPPAALTHWLFTHLNVASGVGEGGGVGGFGVGGTGLGTGVGCAGVGGGVGLHALVMPSQQKWPTWSKVQPHLHAHPVPSSKFAPGNVELSAG